MNNDPAIDMFFVFQFQLHHTLSVLESVVHAYRLADLAQTEFDPRKMNWDLITCLKSEQIPLALYCTLHNKQHYFVPDSDLEIMVYNWNVYENRVKQWPNPIQLRPFMEQYVITTLTLLNDSRFYDTLQYKCCRVLLDRFLKGVSD